jgi:thiosulfate dehydrogenase
MKSDQEQNFGTLLVKLAHMIGLSAVATTLLLVIVITLRATPAYTFLPDLPQLFIATGATDETDAPALGDDGQMWKAPDLASSPASEWHPGYRSID